MAFKSHLLLLVDISAFLTKGNSNNKMHGTANEAALIDFRFACALVLKAMLAGRLCINQLSMACSACVVSSYIVSHKDVQKF